MRTHMAADVTPFEWCIIALIVYSIAGFGIFPAAWPEQLFFVESVFAWPGLGMLAFESLFARDLNLLLGIFLLSSTLVVAVNLVVDIIYCFLDPRIEIN